MSKYDELFAETIPDNSVFAEKGALDPLADPAEILSREEQERRLARILNGVHEGYLPTTVSVYGPPGTGKTLTTRRLCQEFAARTETMALEYVNLKECRSLFSAANELHLEVTGEKKGAYEGLDGVFEGIWEALAEYPDWTVILLDEIDHVQHDSNYDPNEFFYRLLRGEGKRTREIQLSAWLISNELLEVDLRLDSRVQSAMSDEQVFFPPYDAAGLGTILEPRLEQAFRAGALDSRVIERGITQAARRWGDARKTLTLFRRAGETANERGLDQVTMSCLDANLTATERETTLEKLQQLPLNHLAVLTAAVTRRGPDGEIRQPVTVAEIHTTLADSATASFRLGKRAIRTVITDLETMGLVETWIDSKGREGRIKQIRTTFDPEWVRQAQADVTNELMDDAED